MHFGLFCLHTLSFSGTEYILGRSGIDKENVVGLDYRGNGWPGKISIRLKNGSEKKLDFKSTWDTIFGSFLFTPIPCLMCPDMTAKFSDISFGDAWFSKLKHEKEGWSVVLARESKAKKILQDAKSEGRIHLHRMSRNEFLDGGHKLGIIFKKNVNVSIRRALLMNSNSLRTVKPQKSASKTRGTNFSKYMLALIVTTNSRASVGALKIFLQYVPSCVLRVYTFFVRACRRFAS